MPQVPPTPEVCSLLKERLKEAEAEAREAMREVPSDHALVEPVEKLLAVHLEIREMLLQSFEAGAVIELEHDPEVAAEAVRIEREAHQLKPDFMDVLKALFMWKDDPVARVKEGNSGPRVPS